MHLRTNLIGVTLALLGAGAIAQTNTFPASGNVGIGTTSPSALIHVNESAPSGTFDVYAGQPASSLSGWVQYAPTLAKSNFVSLNDAAATSGELWTALNVVTQDNSTNGIWGMTSYASGINPSGTVNSFLGGLLGNAILESTGTVTEADGGSFGVSGTGGGTITNAYAVHATPPALFNAGATIVNNYGIAVDDQTAGQTNFAIITGLGTVSFGDHVGIGTTNPGAGYKLDVAGVVNASGGVNFPNGGIQTVAYTGVTCGGDYAESIDVTGDRTTYAPGDVLVIDPDTPGRFLKSAEPYSTAVTGIYSTKPGTVGRRQTTPKTADEVPMAMVGIVPAKVSGENGPIKPGDLLVSSSRIGYAMKGTDRSRMLGAVIGKALGSLDSGTGVIEVVVTLQ